MEGPKSVELKRLQVIEVLNKVMATKAKPADRVIPRKILEAVEGMPEFDKAAKGFKKLEGEQAMIDAIEAAKAIFESPTTTPEEKATAEKAGEAGRKKLDEAVKNYFEEKLLVPWERKERKLIWEQYRKEFEAECTLPREDAIVAIGAALGKSGEIEDMYADAIEEAEKAEAAEEKAEAAPPVKPELVK
ncbi:MAG: hypothetical protein V1929_03410 [bacterium]